LALRAAAVLHAADTEPTAEHVEQRTPVVVHLDLATVEAEAEGHD
jgi:hypothetical protein